MDRAPKVRRGHSTQLGAGRAFLLGFLAGAGYFGGTVYWTGTVVTQFGGLSWPVGVIVAALLVAYLALFPGLFALCLGWLGTSSGSARCSSRPQCGSPQSSLAPISGVGSPGCCWATARRPCSRSRSWRVSSGSSACPLSSRPWARRSRTSSSSRSTGSIATLARVGVARAGYRALGESSAVPRRVRRPRVVRFAWR